MRGHGFFLRVPIAADRLQPHFSNDFEFSKQYDVSAFQLTLGGALYGNNNNENNVLLSFLALIPFYW